MKFGLNIINFGPTASATAIASTVQWAESLGFHLVMLSDHVTVTPDVGQRYPEPFYEPFTTLAWLAGKTTRIQLGTTVVRSCEPMTHDIHPPPRGSPERSCLRGAALSWKGHPSDWLPSYALTASVGAPAIAAAAASCAMAESSPAHAGLNSWPLAQTL